MKNVPTAVSVVIPAYNAAHLLPGCIESILAQTVRPQEIIVVDDGSADHTAETVQRYSDFVTYIRQENGGSGAARNTGCKAARCEWIAFLDADDRWLPQKQEMQLACAQVNPSGSLIYCDALLTGPYRPRSGTFLSGQGPFNGWVFDQLLEWCFLMPSMSMLRKAALMDVGGFKTSLKSREDYDLWLRLSRKYEFYGLSTSLVVYERQENSLSRHYAEMLRSGIQVMTDLLTTELSPLQRQKVRLNLAKLCFDLSYAVRKSNPPECVQAAWRAACLQPIKLNNWSLVMKSLGWKAYSFMPASGL